MKYLSLVYLVLAATLAFGQFQETVIYSFGAVPNDGSGPVSSLIADKAGNLYGTTLYGGDGTGGGVGAGGTVFELSPQAGGSWVETILYNFCSQAACADGKQPQAGLVMDPSGNLYGTTWYGGTETTECEEEGGDGCGTVFELSPHSNGVWTERILLSFCAQDLCRDGINPAGQMVMDSSGNLYGTSGGGSGGIAFELSPVDSGWSETILYSFCSQKRGDDCTDGLGPVGGVTLDEAGNLYGATEHGGRYSHGIVYQLSPSVGRWTQKVLLDLYSNGSKAPVTFDHAGNLYGTTLSDVFQLNVSRQNLYSKPFSFVTGDNSAAGVLIDPLRNSAFGTAPNLGTEEYGTVWEVTPARQLVPIYNFCSLANCTDGAAPYGGLIEDRLGNLYGTTEMGGAYGNGVIFEISHP